MPIPFPEYAEPLPTLLPKFEALPYEALPSLAEEAPILGEFVEAASEVALAGALAEPALLLGGGILAGMAAEAIFNKLNPSHPKPTQKASRGGGRIGGGSWTVGVHYKTTGAGSVDTFFNVAGNVLGLLAGGFALGSILYYIYYEGGRELVLSDPPETILEPPTITSITPNDGGSPANVPAQPVWESPGLGVLPDPALKDIALPDGSTMPYTVQPLPSPSNLPTAKPNQPFPLGIMVFMPEPGIIVNFTPTNVQIAFTTGLSTSTLLRPPIGGYDLTAPPKEACPCPDADLTKVYCLLGELESHLLDNGYNYTVHTGASGNSGSQSITTDEPYSVSFTVTHKPENAKKESGGDNSPQVVFSGWWSQTIDGKPSQRVPIHYEQTTFLLDKACEGYSFCFYFGFTGTSQYTTRKKRDFSSSCG
jgi:hypothetical protein